MAKNVGFPAYRGLKRLYLMKSSAGLTGQPEYRLACAQLQTSNSIRVDGDRAREVLAGDRLRCDFGEIRLQRGKQPCLACELVGE